MRSLEAALGLSKDVKEGDVRLPWGDHGGVSNDSSDLDTGGTRPEMWKAFQITGEAHTKAEAHQAQTSRVIIPLVEELVTGTWTWVSMILGAPFCVRSHGNSEAGLGCTLV